MERPVRSRSIAGHGDLHPGGGRTTACHSTAGTNGDMGARTDALLVATLCRSGSVRADPSATLPGRRTHSGNHSNVVCHTWLRLLGRPTLARTDLRNGIPGKRSSSHRVVEPDVLETGTAQFV